MARWEATPLKIVMRSGWVIGVLILAFSGACGGDESAEGEGDASAELACSHFRNVSGDAADGLLTDAELRDKLKEVHEDAQVSEEPGVADSARRMLAAATSGDTAELELAITAMDQACSDAGF
jgi:hypothetical protein